MTNLYSIPINRKDYIDKIAKYLARFVEEVKSYNDMNLYDNNIHSENALIPILNAVFDIKLQNANSFHKKNYPSVDLIDEENKIAFQVTSTASLEKVKTTLIKFGENNLQSKYETLYIYILTQKEDKYSDKVIKENTPVGLDFTLVNHIIENSGFKSEVAFDDTYLRKINNSDIEDILKKNDSLEKVIQLIA